MAEPLIAIQLYTVRSAGDLAARLALAQAAGFGWAESEALHGLAPADFAATFEAAGIRLASMHVEMSDLADRLPQVIDALNRCACTQLVMPWLDDHERPSSVDGWIALGQQLNGYAAQLATQGIRLAYHNHAFEFERLPDGRTVLETLFDAAPGLRWQPDVAWIARAGEEPMPWLQRYEPRLQSVHVKDLAGPQGDPAEQGWAALGEGRLPWTDWLPWLAARTGTFIVEHDHPLDARRTAAAGQAFLARHFGTP